MAAGSSAQPSAGVEQVKAAQDVQRLKHDLSEKSVKTLNNATALNILLKKALEWEIVERVDSF